MSAFQRALKATATEARHTVTLPPSAFAESCSRRPSGPAKIGLRSISDLECEVAQSMAAKEAWDAHPKTSDHELRLEIYNDHLMTNILARACVQASDVKVLYFAPAPEVYIREALTPAGIRRLWEEYERVCIMDAPCSPEATDAEIAAFGARLVAGMPVATARLRRLLRAAMNEV